MVLTTSTGAFYIIARVGAQSKKENFLDCHPQNGHRHDSTQMGQKWRQLLI